MTNLSVAMELMCNGQREDDRAYCGRHGKQKWESCEPDMKTNSCGSVCMHVHLCGSVVHLAGYRYICGD
jgi:hypothetical protein